MLDTLADARSRLRDFDHGVRQHPTRDDVRRAPERLSEEEARARLALTVGRTRPAPDPRSLAAPLPRGPVESPGTIARLDREARRDAPSPRPRREIPGPPPIGETSFRTAETWLARRREARR